MLVDDELDWARRPDEGIYTPSRDVISCLRRGMDCLVHVLVLDPS
jgi:hypothetical protein